ncbi:MAG: 1-acyl-sn-glycerol-3-phosphate acyltransferase [Clostridia bacterium]|nr:1-acyl-sn-glycerol-3-phosphate acyltransferase [Clostridia bacterium]
MSKISNKTNVIPVFYACDENFVKYAVVSIKSLIENACEENFYKIYILNSGISENAKNIVKELERDYATITFVNVCSLLEKSSNFPLRDYYSKTTYYRFYISELFPEYDKVLYIDSDTVILSDVSNLYNIDIGENLVGACNEQVMIQTEVYGNYVESVLEIDRHNYFNAGVMIINAKEFRNQKVLNEFFSLLKIYPFVVTQDEDYLNVICKGKVHFLNQGYNVEVYGDIPVLEKDFKIIHYIMVSKPWHYKDCRLKEYFWRYAEKTNVYNEILSDLNSYTDSERERDRLGAEKLMQTAIYESERLDRFSNVIKTTRPDRLKVLEKIRLLEKEKKFDVDVEDDPETIILKPEKVDYLSKKLSTRFFTKIANRMATWYYEKEIKKGNFIIKNVIGLENYKSVKGGCFLTCNHFSVYDNYAVWRAIKSEFKAGKRLYKVIREGNYTNFKGLYGFFFRHCNTLPLSSNVKTMKNFFTAVETLISRGETILIYPEQAMWWNYKKPRPLKSGAFKFSAKTKAPIVPCFITMEKSGRPDDGGFDIPAYTVWILPPIYPKEELSEKENAEYLMKENYRVWKELYEKIYDKPLDYEKLCFTV